MLYLALSSGNYFGWGICSKYLIQETSRLTGIKVIDDNEIKRLKDLNIPGDVFHAIGDHSLLRQYPIKGLRNYGYTFFENILHIEAPLRARFFDLIFAGSSWCKERLEEVGIEWAQTLIQGVDPKLFFPIEFNKPSGQEKFVIFSGGKFELRKGQDLVLRAVKVLQDKYDDIVLMCLWQNPWRFSLDTMKGSRLIFVDIRGESFEEIVKHIMVDNGMDPERNIVLPRIDNNQLRSVFANTDVGVFPNRCEGGTNLVLMEYMACAKPVIASYNTGHKDILSEDNALLIRKMTPYEVVDDQRRRVAIWQEPDLDELIAKMEFAYFNRNKLPTIGKQAGEDLKKFSWEATAKNLLRKIEEI